MPKKKNAATLYGIRSSQRAMPKSAAMLVTAVAKISRNMWSMACPMFSSHWVALELARREVWPASMMRIVTTVAHWAQAPMGALPSLDFCFRAALIGQ